ncbi:recombination protein O N-terminal domain-containing protein [Candidatus Kaiserbacteria bacterium]|nr:MAG: recombination protein O N-terminal domain-containing protein [Candidatus Kaiserbacteria bacterium]
MAHDVHTTSAFVLSSANVQDADKLFWLLTEDLGLVFASARSVREETSKLRYSLGDLSYTRTSLVRGRGLWRLTGAENNHKEKLPPSAIEIFGRIATLVRRVMPTDEENKEVFTIVKKAYDTLLIDETNGKMVEILAVARVLYQLGYLSRTSEYKGIIDTDDFSDETITKASIIENKMVDDINSGLSESQL